MAKRLPAIYRLDYFDAQGSGIDSDEERIYRALSQETDREVQFMDAAYSLDPEVASYSTRFLRPREIKEIIKIQKKAESAQRRREFMDKVIGDELKRLGIDLPATVHAMGSIENNLRTIG